MRLLLDEHLSPAVALGLQQVGVDAAALPNWLSGRWRGAPDTEVLTAALSEERTLVSYDCRSLPPLLRLWAETGLHHAGVILIDEKTLRPNDVGGIFRALRALVALGGDMDWTDRVVFLQSQS